MIYIVIPVFNRKEFTRKCLESLARQTFKDFKTIVIDDGSTDGTSEMLAQYFPEVIVLPGDGSLFWTASTNMGVKYALEHGASYVMTLNNDTIAFEDYMQNMVAWAQKKPKALLGAIAFDADSKRPDYVGARVDWKKATYNSLPKESEEGFSGLHEVTHFPGRGLLIPREVFETIGLYDEKNFPQYFADYDFTHAAHKAGFKIYCNYDARIYVYPEESGSNQLRANKSLRKFYHHLFGLKSAANIVLFTKYAIKNSPKKYLVNFLVIGLVKRIGGYLRDWFLESRSLSGGVR